jgi:hypothetical protein
MFQKADSIKSTEQCAGTRAEVEEDVTKGEHDPEA